MSRSRSYLSYEDLVERKKILENELRGLEDEIERRRKSGNLKPHGWTNTELDIPISIPFSFEKLQSRQNIPLEDCSAMNERNKDIMRKIREKSLVETVGEQIVEGVQNAIVENKIKKKPIPIKKHISMINSSEPTTNSASNSTSMFSDD